MQNNTTTTTGGSPAQLRELSNNTNEAFNNNQASQLKKRDLKALRKEKGKQLNLILERSEDGFFKIIEVQGMNQLELEVLDN